MFSLNNSFQIEFLRQRLVSRQFSFSHTRKMRDKFDKFLVNTEIYIIAQSKVFTIAIIIHTASSCNLVSNLLQLSKFSFVWRFFFSLLSIPFGSADFLWLIELSGGEAVLFIAEINDGKAKKNTWIPNETMKNDPFTVFSRMKKDN